MSARSLLAAATVSLLSLVIAPAAHASLLDLASCPSRSLQQPFAPWLDPSTYTLVPDGGLERGGSRWDLDGASVVSGNEPFYAHSGDDRRSLSLPAGASATTPATCVSLDRPTLRFFARRKGVSPFSVLRVDAIFGDPLGRELQLPIGIVLGDGSWAPSLPMTVIANLTASVDGVAPAAFRFTALGGGWQVDDVYVDPYVRH